MAPVARIQGAVTKVPFGHSIRKLLFVSQGLTGEGGIASVARSVAYALDETALCGHVDRVDRVLVNDYPDDSPGPPPKGMQVLAGANKLRAVWNVWRLSHTVEYDLIFFDHIGLARMMTLPFPGMSSRRYAVFVHGMELQYVVEGNRAYRALIGAKHILTNSLFTASRIRRVASEAAARIFPVPLCVEPKRAQRWRNNVPDSTSRRLESVAMVVGRMNAKERGKGHDQLIEAWSRIHAEIPDARLWIVGDGDDRRRYEEKVRRLGMINSVEFLGRVDDDTLGELYRRASIFVMPSRQEGFGIVYAEAMWHALPCIASRNDAAREIIEEGRTGMLVDYGDVKALYDRLALCLRDPDLVKRLGATARKQALERFSYDRFKRDLLNAIAL